MLVWPQTMLSKPAWKPLFMYAVVFNSGKEFAAIHLLLFGPDFQMMCHVSTDSSSRLPLSELQAAYHTRESL
jgi:hypothetical protein